MSLRNTDFRSSSFRTKPVAQSIRGGSIKIMRNGVGNRAIDRPGFDSPPVMGRDVLPFDSLQPININRFEQRPEVSDETVREMFIVNIPDETDVTWIAERDRLVDIHTRSGLNEDEIRIMMEVDPPLGRAQRTVSDSISTRNMEVTLAEKIDAISREVLSGMAEGQASEMGIISILITILDSPDKIENLSTDSKRNLASAMKRLKIPTDHETFGIPRIVDSDYYNENRGRVNLFLLNSLPGLSLSKPISGLRGNPVELSHAVSELDNGRFMDMRNRSLITLQDLRVL